jgi:hypothetical protein
MESVIVEVEGPEGRFIIRAEPRDVAGASVFAFGALWLWALLGRKARRGQPRIIQIRRWLDDPLGRPIYEEVVHSRAHIQEAMTRAEQRVRSGHVRQPDSW